MSEQPTQYRSDSVYVTKDIRRGLSYAASKEDGWSADQLAVEVLKTWLYHKHPEIMAYIEQGNESEKQFRDSLKSSKPPF
jgi:hypothetical protein